MHTTPKINTFLFHSLHIQYVSSVSMILVHWYYWRSGKVKVLLNEKRKTTCDASCCCCLYVYTHVRTYVAEYNIYTIYSVSYRIYLFSESGEKSKKEKGVVRYTSLHRRLYQHIGHILTQIQHCVCLGRRVGLEKTTGQVRHYLVG